MRPRPFAACAVLAAASLTAWAPGVHGTDALPLVFEEISFTAAGTPVAGRAQLVTPSDLDALVAQARAGTLRRIELQVGPGPLRDALRGASEGGSRFRLTADLPAAAGEEETYLSLTMTAVRITRFNVHGASARVSIVPGRVDLVAVAAQRRPAQAQGTPRTAPRPAGGGGSLQTPGGPPVVPSKRPGAGLPDQGLGAPPLPDLEIRKVAPAPGAPNALAVTVRNDGVGPAGATQLKLYVPADGGKVLTAQAPVPALAAGQSAEVKIGVGGQPIAEANLRVDDPNVVGETDELNNGFHYTAGK
jgi:hypothetical protein